MQIGSRDGGMPGEAPADQAEDGTSTGRDSKAPAKGESNPTVQTKDSPGGETEPNHWNTEVPGHRQPEPLRDIQFLPVTPEEMGLSAPPGTRLGKPNLARAGRGQSGYAERS